MPQLPVLFHEVDSKTCIVREEKINAVEVATSYGRCKLL